MSRGIEMTELDYKQIIKNQDIISQLSLEEINDLQILLDKRKYDLKPKPPKYHILHNPDNIKVSKKDIVDDNLIPRVVYTISVNKEAVMDHKNHWREYLSQTVKNVDNYINNLIFQWMQEKLQKVIEES